MTIHTPIRPLLLFLISIIITTTQACTPPAPKTNATPKISDLEKIIYPRFFIENQQQKDFFYHKIFDKINNGTLIIYKDEFLSQPTDYQSFIKKYNHTDTLLINDQTPAGYHYQMTTTIFNPDKIIAYKIAAELTDQATLAPISIAPMIDLISDSAVIGQTPIFWVNYKDLQ